MLLAHPTRRASLVALSSLVLALAACRGTALRAIASTVGGAGGSSGSSASGGSSGSGGSGGAAGGPTADGGDADVPWSKRYGDAGLMTVVTVQRVGADDTVIARTHAQTSPPGFSVSTGPYVRYAADGSTIWECADLASSACQEAWPFLLPQVGQVSAGVTPPFSTTPCTTDCIYVVTGGKGGSPPSTIIHPVDAIVPGGVEVTSWHSTVVGAAGEICIDGSFRPNVGGPQWLFLACFAPDGSLTWARTITGPSVIGLGSLAAAGGDLVATMMINGPVDFGGGPEAVKTDVALKGWSGVVARYGPTGNLAYHRILGDTADSNVQPYNVVADANGNLLLGGSFHGSVDFGGGPLVTAADSAAFFVKLGAAGDQLFSMIVAEGQVAVVPKWLYATRFLVATDPSGDAWLCGSLLPGMSFAGQPLASQGALDLLVLRYDGNGKPLAHRQFAASGAVCDGIAVGKSGVPVVNGEFTGSLDAGQGPLVAQGAFDAFVAKLGP